MGVLCMGAGRRHTQTDGPPHTRPHSRGERMPWCYANWFQVSQPGQVIGRMGWVAIQCTCPIAPLTTPRFVKPVRLPDPDLDKAMVPITSFTSTGRHSRGSRPGLTVSLAVFLMSLLDGLCQSRFLTDACFVGLLRGTELRRTCVPRTLASGVARSFIVPLVMKNSVAQGIVSWS